MGVIMKFWMGGGVASDIQLLQLSSQMGSWRRRPDNWSLTVFLVHCYTPYIIFYIMLILQLVKFTPGPETKTISLPDGRTDPFYFINPMQNICFCSFYWFGDDSADGFATLQIASMLANTHPGLALMFVLTSLSCPAQALCSIVLPCPVPT